MIEKHKTSEIGVKYELRIVLSIQDRKDFFFL